MIRLLLLRYYRHTLVDAYTGSDASEKEFISKTGFSQEDLRGKLVLDAGVGTGRFADIVSQWGADVVGTDLSLSVEAAHEMLGKRPNVWIAQADIGAMPFLPKTFDAIFSIGVLHHTQKLTFVSLSPSSSPAERLPFGFTRTLVPMPCANLG